MDLRAVGTGPADLGILPLPAIAAPGRPAPPLIGADSITVFLRDLSQAQFASLLGIIDHSPSPQVAARLDQLLAGAVSAATARDIPVALANLEAFVALAPARVEILRQEPGLAPIQPQVEAWIARLAAVAKMDAEGRIGRAEQLLGAALQLPLPVLPAPAASAARAADAPVTAGTLTAILQELSQVDFASLVDLIRRSPSPQVAVRLEHLLHAALSAAEAQDAPRALVHLAEFAALASQQVETLRSDPAFSPVQPRIEPWIRRLVSVVQAVAGQSLAQARQLLDIPPEQKARVIEIVPERLVSMARRLVDAGGLANCVHAAELAQVVIDFCRWAPNAVVPALYDSPGRICSQEVERPGRSPILTALFRASAALRKQALARAAVLWVRAPLLVLLLAWFALGLTGGTAALLLHALWPEEWPRSLAAFVFDLWGIGFLALVALGFYLRVRRARF